MANPLIECIPNYSEARRPEVVEAILASIRAVEGVVILDKHSDLDHNRTVVTLIGTPGCREEAAFQSIKKAGELINLTSTLRPPSHWRPPTWYPLCPSRTLA